MAVQIIRYGSLQSSVFTVRVPFNAVHVFTEFFPKNGRDPQRVYVRREACDLIFVESVFFRDLLHIATVKYRLFFL